MNGDPMQKMNNILKPKFIRYLHSGMVVLAIVGVWVTGSLVADHDGPWKVESEKASLLLTLCESTPLPSVNCAEVVGSRWGSFDFYVGSRRFLVPTSFVGLSYFVSLLIWLLMIGPMVQQSIWFRRGLLALFASSMLFSIFFSAQLAFSLSQRCPLCVIVHLINAIMFVCAIIIYKSSHAADEKKMNIGDGWRAFPLERRLILSAITIICASVVGLWVYYDSTVQVKRYWQKALGHQLAMEKIQEDADLLLREYYAQPIVNLPRKYDQELNATDEDHHRLVIFMNYNCNSCACFEQDWKEKFTPKMSNMPKIEIRYFPYSVSQADSLPANKKDAAQACYAAVAARMEGDTYAQSMMHHLLFKHRKDQPKRNYLKLASKIGIDKERFQQEWTSDEVRRVVDEDIQLADRLGVTSTPAVFLNGRRVPYLCLKSSTFWKAVTDVDPSSSRQIRTVLQSLPVKNAKSMVVTLNCLIQNLKRN